MRGDTDRPSFRRLPSVERLLQRLAASGTSDRHPRQLVVACVREVVERARRRLREGRTTLEALSLEALAADAQALLVEWSAPSLDRAVNATGIIIHTNLGRAPLSDAARAALDAASGYTPLEVDRATGDRGSRQAHVGELLRQLTGADAALVVNNNAGAVLLALAALARGRQTIISRGELVEIGGSFRMPDVMAASGCQLVEVGTTNKTYLADYEAALTPETALLVKVHRSNFSMRGFVHDVSPRELAVLGQRAGVPVLFDMGSGAFVDMTTRGLPVEPTVQWAIASGVDLVSASGDKLLGGPQAGLIVGRRDAVAAARRHPLARALRIDKLSLAALEATLRLYLDPERALHEIPVLAMLAVDEATLAARAGRLAAAIGDRASVTRAAGKAGGGALPLLELEGPVVSLDADPEPLAQALRHGDPPVIARIHDGQVLLDPRTLADDEVELVAGAARGALSGE